MGSKFGYHSIYWGAGVWEEKIRIYAYIHSKKGNCVLYLNCYVGYTNLTH